MGERKATMFLGSEGGVGPTSSAPTHREYLDMPRGRLALVAFLVGALSSVATVLLFTIPEHDPTGEAKQFVRNGWSAAAQVFVAFLVVAVAKSRRFSDRTVMWVAFGFQILLCANASYGLTFTTLERVGYPPPVTWAEIFIVFFPMLIPSPPRMTALVASLSAATRPGAVLLVCAQQNIEVEPYMVLMPTIVASMAVLFSLVGSRVLHGLGKDLEHAKRMGSYQLEERIGKGGMGEVWRASHRFLARPAAIKLIRAESAGGSSSEGAVVARRFEREAQATSMLKSPHTVELYDYGRTDDGRFYYVMELLDGVDLHEAIERYGPMPPERVVHVLTQLCHSLHEAHESGLVHRDIKPANLFLCHYGTDYDFVKVLDFGLVTSLTRKTAVEQNGAATAANTVVGTPGFISPEAVTGEGIDRRADIYAVGCLFYWLLAGRLVFEEDTPMAAAVAHASKPPPPLPGISDQDLPAAIIQIAEDCLSKDATERPQTALEVADRLRAVPFDEPWTERHAREWWQTNR